MMKWVKARWWRRDSLINEVHKLSLYLSLVLPHTYTLSLTATQSHRHTHTHTQARYNRNWQLKAKKLGEFVRTFIGWMAMGTERRELEVGIDSSMISSQMRLDLSTWEHQPFLITSRGFLEKSSSTSNRAKIPFRTMRQSIKRNLIWTKTKFSFI